MDSDNKQQPKQNNLSKLPPELLARLKEIEKDSPQFKQLEAIEDIADIVQDIHSASIDSSELLESAFKQVGAILVDSRESLKQIADKQDPKQPDVVKPIVKAIEVMQASIAKELKNIDVKPQIKLPELPTPSVTVQPTDVVIDLSRLEKALKTLEKAVVGQIKAIPEVKPTNINPITELQKESNEWLESIDHAVRLKPTFPNTMAIGNMPNTFPLPNDQMTALTPQTYKLLLDDTSTPNVTYVGKATIGSAPTSSAWQIQKIDEATGLSITWASTGLFTTKWSDRTTETYT